MNDQEETDAGAEVAWLTVETGEDADTGLTEGEDDCEQFLRSLVEFAVGLEVEVDVDEMGASKKLWWR